MRQNPIFRLLSEKGRFIMSLLTLELCARPVGSGARRGCARRMRRRMRSRPRGAAPGAEVSGALRAAAAAARGKGRERGPAVPGSGGGHREGPWRAEVFPRNGAADGAGGARGGGGAAHRRSGDCSHHWGVQPFLPQRRFQLPCAGGWSIGASLNVWRGEIGQLCVF